MLYVYIYIYVILNALDKYANTFQCKIFIYNNTIITTVSQPLHIQYTRDIQYTHDKSINYPVSHNHQVYHYTSL